MAEGVERELRDLGQRARLRMLLLQGGLLDAAAAGRGWKRPFAFHHRAPRFQDGRRPLRDRDRAAGIFGFSERDVAIRRHTRDDGGDQ
jgi:hypothetical protein